jgi:tape measure domain-containing protein
MSTYQFRFNLYENLTAKSQQITAAFNRTSQAATALATRVNTIPRSINQLDTALEQLRKQQRASFDVREIRKFQREIDDTTRRMERLTGVNKRASFGGLGGMGALAIGAGVGYAATDAIKTATKHESMVNALGFSSGGEAQAAERLTTLRGTVERLGLPLMESIQGFKTLDSSLIGTGITAQQSDAIFRGVSSGVSALSLSADDAQGVFLALGQVASKGKVQAEELRGQIGERLPGAFNIAARAMGVSNAELDKMMSLGKLTAADFLPKFAAEIEKTFAGALPKAMNAAQAKLNRFNNAIYDLKVMAGTVLLPAILPAFTRIGEGLTALVKHFGQWYASHKQQVDDFGNGLMRVGAFVYNLFSDVYTAIAPVLGVLWTGFTALLDVLKPVVSWLEKHREVVSGLAVTMGALYVWYKACTVVSAAWAAVMMFNMGDALFSVIWKVQGLTATLKALNLTMLLNPVFLIVAGFIALAAAVQYAWNNSESFRGVVSGLGFGLMELGSIINDWVVQPLWAMGKAMASLFTFDISKITAAGDEMQRVMQSAVNKGNPLDRLNYAWTDGAVKGMTSEMKLDLLGGLTGNGFLQDEKSKREAANRGEDEQSRGAYENGNGGGLGVTQRMRGGGARGGALGGSGSGASVSGEPKGMKNITFNIQALVKEIHITAVKDVVEMKTAVKKHLIDAIMEATNEANHAI